MAATLGPMLVAGLLLAAPNPALADGELAEHPHQPRHGGYFGDADDLYHYELLLEPGRRLVLYVNDEHNLPLDVRTLQGRWTVNPDGPSSAAGTFHSSTEGTYFVATLPSLAVDPLPLVVAVLKDGAWVELEFELPVPPSAGSSSNPAASP